MPRGKRKRKGVTLRVGRAVAPEDIDFAEDRETRWFDVGFTAHARITVRVEAPSMEAAAEKARTLAQRRAIKFSHRTKRDGVPAQGVSSHLSAPSLEAVVFVTNETLRFEGKHSDIGEAKLRSARKGRRRSAR